LDISEENLKNTILLKKHFEENYKNCFKYLEELGNKWIAYDTIIRLSCTSDLIDYIHSSLSLLFKLRENFMIKTMN